MSACASGISGYLVKLRIAIPNTVAFLSLAAIPFLLIPAKAGTQATLCAVKPRATTSSRIQAFRIKLPQHRKFLHARWLGRRHVVVEQQCETRVIPHLFL